MRQFDLYLKNLVNPVKKSHTDEMQSRTVATSQTIDSKHCSVCVSRIYCMTILLTPCITGCQHVNRVYPFTVRDLRIDVNFSLLRSAITALRQGNQELERLICMICFPLRLLPFLHTFIIMVLLFDHNSVHYTDYFVSLFRSTKCIVFFPWNLRCKPKKET